MARAHIPAVSLILSYIFDWVVIIVLVGVGAGLNYVRPQHRPFSLLSLENSYPLRAEQVPTWLAGILAIAAPAAIIAVVALVFIPGLRAMRSMDRARAIRVKLWELEKGLAGLCLSAAAAFFITQGMKNLFGKPRPNMLARSCQPDLSNIDKYVVGGYGQDISSRWTLVTYEICTLQDQHTLDDGFRSFPSGHSSISWSGLLYLTLFLMAKFNVSFPHLPFQSSRDVQPSSPQKRDDEYEMTALHNREGTEDSAKRSTDIPDAMHSPSSTTSLPAHPFRIRHMAASPPNYLLIPVFLPIGVAIWICSTRWADYFHFGFDILFGSFIGIFTSWFSFRWYHLPLSRGQGWAWGARSKERAFAIGVGTSGWVGDEGWSMNSSSKNSSAAEGDRMV